MNKQKSFLLILLGIFVAWLAIAGIVVVVFFKDKSISLPGFPTPKPSSTPISQPEGIEKFTSEQEFKDYLAAGEASYYATAFDGGAPGAALRQVGDLVVPEAAFSPSLEKAEPGRVSETTVQVKGIDEPDIVKTDGSQIYFSSRSTRFYPLMGQPLVEVQEKIAPTYLEVTKIIKAFPPADLKKDSEIEKTGDLLLYKDILVIFTSNYIYGYDVSDPKSPEQLWKVELKEKNFLVGARLYENKIYMVTSSRVNKIRPCPIEPLSIGGTGLAIRCSDIYHPIVSVPVDVTYTAVTINPKSGEVENKVSFVGSSSASVVYMSKNALYATYSYYGDLIEFVYNFFNEKGQDLIPSSILEKLKKLQSYDISDAAKFMEFGLILEEYQNSLDDDERLRIENEVTNRMEDYYKERKRELEKTGIIKIGLDELDILATGEVAGQLLNQFSLDEYEGNLRVATTISGRGMLSSTGESANDVYVLNKDLKVVGSVKDLGITERIYSVRFIEDKGYIVTFKQIDPFFVLDLSNPKKPELKGELKIPGYSSYLHPVTKDKILGIGKEGSQVKISLFDVTDPNDPTEAAKYTLKEYWSDVLNTHHAFLLDTKHGVFFLPGSQGGYVFSYENDKLKLEKAVSNIQARRAIYINDYMYIIGENKLVVLNEIDWEEVNQMEL